MPTEYISREAAIKHIKDNQCKGCSDIGLCGSCAVLIALKLLKNVPSADVRPVVHGEWIVDSIASNIFTCSVCGQDAPVEPTGGTEYKSNFCPYCGADMREDRNGTP